MAGTEGPNAGGPRATDGDDTTRLDEVFAARRQALVGQLAGAIAHDLNNVLTAVLGYSEMLLGDAGPGHPWRADLEEIYASGQRAAQLVRRLLAFSRQVVALPQLLSWTRLIEEVEPLLRPLIGEQNRLDLEFDEAAGGVEVTVDKGEASEILLSLGALARLTETPGGLCRCRVTGPVADGSAAAALGIRQEVRFAVFAGSREGFPPASVQALGAGLRHVRALVEHVGGRVVARADGASWSVVASFPVDQAGALATAAAPTDAAARRQGLTALVAEDEDLLRQVVRRMLLRSGFNVVEAASGEEALAELERTTPPVDLLITDVVMPGISGVDLARRVAERRPGVRVLYISGYTDAASVDLPRTGLRTSFLAKPFTKEQLLQSIDGLIA
jgi:two-component system cell cycle sensor histidine kinase/response regulator CckA